ncbi:MAG: hypothetical protein WBW33_01380 [Bryobacteraceae bacterium]
MNIEIHKPELEALIQQQLQTGAFRDVEDVLMHALTLASTENHGEPTGTALVAAMQACPVKDFEFEPERFPMPVRDIAF